MLCAGPVGQGAQLPPGGAGAAAGVRGQDSLLGRLANERSHGALPYADRGGRFDPGGVLPDLQEPRGAAGVSMKRLAVLMVLLAAGGAGLYYAERHKQESRVGPQAMLNALADTQREISRVPASVTR